MRYAFLTLINIINLHSNSSVSSVSSIQSRYSKSTRSFIQKYSFTSDLNFSESLRLLFTALVWHRTQFYACIYTHAHIHSRSRWRPTFLSTRRGAERRRPTAPAARSLDTASLASHLPATCRIIYLVLFFPWPGQR